LAIGNVRVFFVGIVKGIRNIFVLFSGIGAVYAELGNSAQKGSLFNLIHGKEISSQLNSLHALLKQYSNSIQLNSSMS
jgi:hypothetical protein